MAFALTSRISDTGGTAGQSKTTASFTPAANSLLVVVASAQRENHATAQTWSISDSASLTWTSRATSTNITGNFGGGIQVWTAQVGASPASMTVTVDPWSTAVTGWIGLEVFDITGHDTSSTFPQAATTNTTTSTGNSVSLTVTLGSSPTNGNLVLGLFTGQNDASGAFASITGFTQLSAPSGTFNHIGVWYRSDTTSTGITQSDLGQTVNWGAGVAMEVKSASSDTNADAGSASAAAAANNATVNVDANAGQASATATANNATTAADVAAGAASATAAALDATTTADVNAGAASAAAAALDATVNIDANAGVASATATAYDATVSTDSKWENYTDDFPGSALGSLWNAPYGDAITVSGNKATFPTTTTTYSGFGSSTTHSLIGSYVLVYLNPRTTGGYIGISVKASNNTDIMAASYRHTAGQLWGDYNGSDWSDTDSQGTVSFSGADVWLRVREASGTGYMEYSTDGSTWNTIHSDTLSASALTELATAKIELNQGPFSSSITSTGSFSKFNLPASNTNADAGAASATAAASDATVNVDASAGAASATAAALDATTTADVNAGAASATAAAQDATSTVDADAGAASAVATAYDATVTTSGSNTDATAELASAAAAAQDATTTVDASAGAASAVATAYDATVTTSVGADAGAASATAAAYDATGSVAANAGVASATATAYDASVSISGTQFRLTALAPIRALVGLAPRAGVKAQAPIRALYAKEPTRDPA